MILGAVIETKGIEIKGIEIKGKKIHWPELCLTFLATNLDSGEV